MKPTPSDIGAYTKSETDQKIAQAISDSTDLNKIYPVGIVTWFNSNVNPNTALPGLTWTYLNNGVGRDNQGAAANGSDVATTGGSDSVTLAVGNLPSLIVSLRQPLALTTVLKPLTLLVLTPTQ